MKKLILALFAFPAAALAQPGPSPEQLRDAALHDTVAWDIAEGLTTEVGPRLAGTEAAAWARTWAVAKLKSLGFQNVHVEPFDMPVWVRGTETAAIVSPFPQPMAVTALGRSGSTGDAGITAPVIGFDSVDALRAAPAGSLKGRIAFLTNYMKRTQDGSGYRFAGPVRWNAPSIAAQKGAAAIVIRSVGTDHHRNPHTGDTTWEDGVTPIPAGALSVPDAENLSRMLARSDRVVMKLVLTPKLIGQRTSGNVVADVPGSDPAAGVVLVGGHLDSWDLGTGAIDDAAGVAITTAAARHVMDAGRPRRTVRVILFGAEEPGGLGGKAYFARHRQDGNVVFVSESDFGADRVWSVLTHLDAGNDRLGKRVAALVAPLGVLEGSEDADAGEDLGPWLEDGVAAIEMQQDGTRYFDIHHTPDDTLDKIDPEQLRQNVAAWTAMIAAVANAPEAIARLPKTAPTP